MLNASSSDGTQVIPAGNLLAKAAPANPCLAPSNLAAMNPASVANVGGSQAHLNMQPFLTINFCIALQGIFPSAALPPAGGDQPHNNLMPYLTFYFCIALQGVFPPRS